MPCGTCGAARQAGIGAGYVGKRVRSAALAGRGAGSPAEAADRAVNTTVGATACLVPTGCTRYTRAGHSAAATTVAVAGRAVDIARNAAVAASSGLVLAVGARLALHLARPTMVCPGGAVGAPMLACYPLEAARRASLAPAGAAAGAPSVFLPVWTDVGACLARHFSSDILVSARVTCIASGGAESRVETPRLARYTARVTCGRFEPAWRALSA